MVNTVRTEVINFFGGPGSGKSTTAAEVFALMKHRGVNVELVREYAKDVMWEGRLSLFANQLYILAKQNKRMDDLQGKVDLIITDSPLIMQEVYLNQQSAYYFALEQLVRRCFYEFSNFNVFIERVKPYNPKGRMQTEMQAREIDDQLHDLVNYNASVPGAEPAAKEVLGLYDQWQKRSES